MHNHHFYILFVLMTFMMTSCKTTDFVSEETIDTKNEVSKIINFNKNNKELGEFLNNHNLAIPTAGDPWGPDLLVMVGLYANDNLKVKRAEYGVKAAEIQIIAAGYPKIVNPLFEYHTLGKPFTLGLSIEIPNQKNSIKDLKIDIAKINAKNTILNLLNPAWNVRSEILLSLVDVLRHEADLLIMQEINKKLASNFQLALKNYEKGIIPFTELNQFEKLLEVNKNDLILSKSNIHASRIKLASVLSVPADFILPLDLIYNYEHLFNYNINDEVYLNNINHALLNRADIIKSLSDYAKVETELRLLVVENNNKIILFKPALLWDQTDLIFSLAGSFIPNNNLTITAKLEKQIAKRDLYKAKFIANQSLALNQIQTNYANLIISESHYLSAISKYEFNKLQYELMKKRQENGDASLLDTQLEELNVLKTYQIIENAKFDKLKSILSLEKVLGHDLISYKTLPDSSFMPINYILNNIEVNTK